MAKGKRRVVAFCTCFLIGMAVYGTAGCSSSDRAVPPQENQPQVQQPPKSAFTEQDAITRAIKERSNDTFPAVPAKVSGTISIPLPSGTRTFPATLQTQVMKKSEQDYVVTLTEWWSSKDFPKVVTNADGTVSERPSTSPETLSYTWQYEVTPEETKVLTGQGDYPPDFAN